MFKFDEDGVTPMGYAKYDEDGVPTHDFEGVPLKKGQIKAFRKKWTAQKKEWDYYQTHKFFRERRKQRRQRQKDFEANDPLEKFLSFRVQARRAREGKGEGEGEEEGEGEGEGDGEGEGEGEGERPHAGPIMIMHNTSFATRSPAHI